MYMEKELALLDALNENELVNQRKLSNLLGMSLGSVNMLIKKMQREGFIKCKNASRRQMAYILTPNGIAEKARKTYKYITHQYRYINEMREKIKKYLEHRVESEKKVCLVLDESEMSEIVALAVREMKNSDKLQVILDCRVSDEVAEECLYLLIKDDDKKKLEGRKVEMLLEML